jgi:hypothetical protein
MNNLSAQLTDVLNAATANGYDLSRNPYCWTSDCSDAYVIACSFAARSVALHSLRKTRGHWWIANGNHAGFVIFPSVAPH